MSANVATVRVMIADDQTLFRVGLARLLEEDPRVEIVGQAGDGVEAVKLAGSISPDVVLMDLKMPNLDGIEATKQIAYKLKISEKTVRNHVSNMYEKLNIYDRSQAVLYAVRKGLVEI